MTELTTMGLKILYTLENGSAGSYLARSKKSYQVRVANIPNPIDPNEANLKIGVIDLSIVLKEMSLNSPEVFDCNNNAKLGHDYNLYFKDICESDEPLVSLGLLSEIKQKLNKEDNSRNDDNDNENDENNEDEEDDDSSIVTGRVSSNFSALLRRSYSNLSKKNSKGKDINAAPETLEVKIRLSKVIKVIHPTTTTISTTTTNSRRPSIGFDSSSKMFAPKHENRSIVSGKMPRPAKILKPMKRQTNPMPAPKAKRTQSLPIWNLKQPTTGLPKNSIAHKIYMADRKTEYIQQNFKQPHNYHNNGNNNNTNASNNTNLTYEINTLQHDNSIQKVEVDDSISKRFDFMLNKKKSSPPSISKFSTTTPPPKNSSFTSTSKIRKNQTSKNRSSKNKTKTIAHNNHLLKNMELKEPIIEEDLTIEQLLNRNNHPALQPIEKLESNENDCNKENVPPPPSTTSNLDLGDLLNFSGMSWLNDDDFSPFDPSLIQQEITPPSNLLPLNHQSKQQPQNANTTPKDPNTCNTIPIEDQENESSPNNNKLASNENDKNNNNNSNTNNNNMLILTSDIERTSPIDTLSMPLMDLNQRQTHGDIVTTCHDQLKRLPLLMHKIVTDKNKTSSSSLSVTHDENATSVLMKFCTPQEQEQDDEDDDERSITRKGTMPSSPSGMMFNYKNGVHDDDVDDDENDRSSKRGGDDSDDLFSSFAMEGGHQRGISSGNVTTPVTQFNDDHSK
ncbi:Spt21p NDAI_0I00970 [Naumovozyma dairenensis CBS 421]|uniref:Ams2/SPT21 N-terminal domain-containing protein n=1 Tax=Naumovozyma dairenensis (strain ATCC 10597 / BCRC 20456 / CBS 421 / NBRC 0211 / NRRL Y-12639) TaxID=1071378 RepID=G0WFV5_NAUDC|nr:hypothetical protein NDAI_0I00970 [Naumovozyma dairenensis CBS 421]CCD26666.1 hypothetical protein NDAI_0I00970 [Naumovozyma dairenensis CBS 421]